MSLGAIIMARTMATQYYVGNMFAAKDGDLALCRNADGSADAGALKNVVNKENKYAYMIQNADLNANIAKQLNDTEKALQDSYVRSFKTFC